jgi:hypothetical protein
MASGAKIAAGAEVGYAKDMLIRLAVLAMLFAASAVAQQQEKSMMERFFNPDMELKSSFEGKSFEGKSFASREFRGADGYAGPDQRICHAQISRHPQSLVRQESL